MYIYIYGINDIRHKKLCEVSHDYVKIIKMMSLQFIFFGNDVRIDHHNGMKKKQYASFD